MFSKTHTEISTILNKLVRSDYNFSGIFISPAGYTIIKSFLTAKNIDISLAIFDENVLSFLRVLGFFNCTDYSIADSKRRQILPIRTINSQEGTEIEDITNEFGELLKEFLGGNKKDLINSMVKIIGELLNNISNHSGNRDPYDETGEVIISANYQSGQFYSKKNFIQIAIVDTGVGFLSSVRRKAHEITTAKDAILKALEPRFTGGTTLDPNCKNFTGITNRGIGLTTTLEILKRLKGDLFIGSLDCLYCYNGKTEDISFYHTPKWKGAYVIFNIYTDTEASLDYMEIEEHLLGDPTITSGIEELIDFG